jgi:hypothetical protein
VVAELDARVQALRVDLQDLLVDRDGLGVEAAVRELLRDLAVLADRRRGIVDLQIEVAELQTRIGVV